MKKPGSKKSSDKTNAMRAAREAAAKKANAKPAAKAAPAAPAAPRKPAVKAPPAAAESGPDATTGRESDRALQKRIGMSRFAAVRVRRVDTVLQRFMQLVGNWTCKVPTDDGGEVDLMDAARNHVNAAREALIEASDAFEQVPQDWKPQRGGARGGRGTDRMGEGTLVEVREKYREGYADVLEANEMTGLTVKKIGKGKVSCVTASGERVVLPRTHLQLVNADEEGEEEVVDEDDEDAAS